MSEETNINDNAGDQGGSNQATIAVIGTGRMGTALAARFCAAGIATAVGSRQADRGRQRAQELNRQYGAGLASGGDYKEAVQAARWVILTVPYPAQAELLAELQPKLAGRVVVVANVALDPEKVDQVSLPPGSSAALQAQAQLGPAVPVVAAFQSLMYRSLQQAEAPAKSDVLVAGDDRMLCSQWIELCHRTGIRAWWIGPLINSIAAEAMTSVLIHLGNQHGSKTAGFRITGVEYPAD